MTSGAAAYGEHHGAGFLRAILERFRRSAGVPAAVRDDLAVELAPLFLALDAIDAEAARVREAAARRAAAIDEATRRDVEQLLADAEAQAEHERAEAAKAGRRATDAELREAEAQALAEADEITRVGRERLPPLVAAVRRCVERAPG